MSANCRRHTEIAMIEEQHVTGYGSLLDPSCTWLENWVMHEYTECYLYWSCYQDETDDYVKKVWEKHFQDELVHLKIASDTLLKYEGREWQQLFVGGSEFPALIKLKSNIEYIKKILKTVRLTSNKEITLDINELPDTAEFFKYQKTVNNSLSNVASHNVIEKYIKKHNTDYRFEVGESVEKTLRNRSVDNTDLARKKGY